MSDEDFHFPHKVRKKWYGGIANKVKVFENGPTKIF